MEKLTVREMKDKIYEEYKDEIDLISKNSKEERPEGTWQADTSVATDMFITYVDNHDDCVLFNINKAKSRLAELRALLGE